MKSKPERKNKFLGAAFIFLALGLAVTGAAGARAQMVAAVPGRQAAVESYDELVQAIRQTRAKSKERIEEAVRQEKVREAWEIGKLIDAHVLQHKERADYDKQVLERLAKDLGESRTEFYYMLEFFREYPIVPPAGRLSWSHYRELLSLNDLKEREEITKQAVSQGWSRDQVREEVRRRQALRTPAEKKEPPAEILKAEPGKPGTYRIVKAGYGPYQNQPVIDLGFSNYYRPPGKFKFEPGNFVTEKNGRAQKLKKENPDDLFTYQVSLVKVIDGDTFAAAVNLGFGFTTVQTLRLRALDAPEIESAEGRKAKEFVEKQFAKAGRHALVKTVRSDKYDRYLADVFIHGEYLNQKLVEEGFAIPVAE